MTDDRREQMVEAVASVGVCGIEDAEQIVDVLRHEGYIASPRPEQEPDEHDSGCDCQVCEQRGERIHALEAELTRVKEEGTPGVLHEVDQAFYDLAVNERDYERRRYDRLEAAAQEVVREWDERGDRKVKASVEARLRSVVPSGSE